MSKKKRSSPLVHDGKTSNFTLVPDTKQLQLERRGYQRRSLFVKTLQLARAQFCIRLALQKTDTGTGNDWISFPQ